MVKTAENSEILFLRSLLCKAVSKISAENKVSEIEGGKKSCLCGVSLGHAGKDAASLKERCRSLKIFKTNKKKNKEIALFILSFSFWKQRFSFNYLNIFQTPEP
jgi:hypothetical protein